MAKDEVCPRDEIADPPGMAVLLIDIYGFDEGLVSLQQSVLVITVVFI